MFADYERLLAKLDAHLASLGALGCPAGCDHCCRLSFAVFPVEAAHLHAAFLRLPAQVRERVLGKRENGSEEECLLLLDGNCVLYPQRPVICRTHGYPLLSRAGDGRDGWELTAGCERAGVVGPAGACGEARGPRALQIDPVNELLVAVNRLFVTQAGLHGAEPGRRIPLADIPLPRLPGEGGHASV